MNLKVVKKPTFGKLRTSDIWMVHLANRLHFEKLQVEVEESKKILYIAFKLPIYGVDSMIAKVSSNAGISFEYVRLGAEKVL